MGSPCSLAVPACSSCAGSSPANPACIGPRSGPWALGGHVRGRALGSSTAFGSFGALDHIGGRNRAARRCRYVNRGDRRRACRARRLAAVGRGKLTALGAPAPTARAGRRTCGLGFDVRGYGVSSCESPRCRAPSGSFLAGRRRRPLRAGSYCHGRPGRTSPYVAGPQPGRGGPRHRARLMTQRGRGGVACGAPLPFVEPDRRRCCWCSSGCTSPTTASTRCACSISGPTPRMRSSGRPVSRPCRGVLAGWVHQHGVLTLVAACCGRRRRTAAFAERLVPARRDAGGRRRRLT